MEKKVFNRIAKYLKGNVSLNEQSAHQEWLKSSEFHQEEFEQLKKIWEHSDLRLQVDEAMTDQQWEKLEKRLLAEKDTPVRTLLGVPSSFYYVAASVALIMLAGLFWIRSTATQDFVKKERGLARIPEVIPTIETQLAVVDEVKAFVLPDGSKVWLDDSSTLSYSDDFNAVLREVTLVGRAFFDVAEDSTKAFIINARTTNIKVLGTSFNVSAVPQANTVEVTVVSGKVAFNVKEGIKRASVSLEADEKGVFYLDNHVLDKRANDDPNFLAWMRPQEEEPLEVSKRRAPSATRDSDVDNIVEPKMLLDHRYNWKKNLINQTVVQGQITNYSKDITYDQFLLKITCHSGNQTKEYAQQYVIDAKIAPGETITYKKAFWIDWLSNTSKVDIQIENVTTE